MNWNPLLQELGKPTIQREVVIQWLTMSRLLDSVLSSYSSLTKITSDNATLHTLSTIDVSTVAAISGLFVPWRDMIERVQATNTLSLHIIVTSYWYLLKSLIVTKDEAADKSIKDKSIV